ncbi:hypothetical protein MUJ63_04495 [Lachnospiraceae bacterium NSJ-143]|nr:hypothetical protein [Lachnospiraceae bacterium NSJ-143]
MDITKYSEENFIKLPLSSQRKIIAEAAANLTDEESKKIYEELVKMYEKEGMEIQKF